jgi:hypothetical protein
MLILPFKHDADGARTAQLTGELAAAAAARFSSYRVITGADLQNVADLESQRQVAGCDEGSTSCLAELAGAMGARLVLFGDLGKLGDTTIVSLNLFLSDQAQSAGRETIRIKNLDELPDAVDAAVARLLGAEVPKAAGVGGGAVIGGVVAGAGVVVGAVGVVLAGTQNDVLANADSSGEQKSGAFALGHAFLWGGLATGVALVGGGVAMMAFSGGE